MEGMVDISFLEAIVLTQTDFTSREHLYREMTQKKFHILISWILNKSSIWSEQKVAFLLMAERSRLHLYSIC